MCREKQDGIHMVCLLNLELKIANAFEHYGFNVLYPGVFENWLEKFKCFIVLGVGGSGGFN